MKPTKDIFKAGSITEIDLILPEVFEEHKDYIYLGPNQYCRVYGVVTFTPSGYVGMFKELSIVFGESIDSTTYITEVPARRSVDLISDKVAVAQSNDQALLKDRGYGDDGYAEAAEDFKQLRSAVQKGQEKVFYVSKSFKIWGRSMEDLEAKHETFMAYCERSQLMVKTYIYNQKEAFLNTLPTIDYRNRKERFRKLLSTRHISILIAEGKTTFNHVFGTLLGTINATKAPLIYDNFVGPPELVNQMMTVFGISGAGKSVFLKILAARKVAIGQWVIIFDIEGEFKALIEYLGGTYYEVNGKEKSGFNPFDIEPTIDKDKIGGKPYLDIREKVIEIREGLTLLASRTRHNALLDEYELVEIESSVRKVYSNKGITEDVDSLYEIDPERETIVDGEIVFNVGKRKKKLPVYSDLKEELAKREGTERIVKLMELITGEESLSFFDCQTTKEFKPGIIGIGLSGVTDDFTKLFSVVQMLSLTWGRLSNYSYANIYKNVILDEGWFFIQFPHAAKILEHFDRRGRKYLIALIIGSQMLLEFLNSHEGKVILNMASTHVIMKQSTKTKELIKEEFALSNDLANQLPLFKAGQAILISENRKCLFKVEPFPFEWPLIKTGKDSDDKNNSSSSIHTI